MNLIERTRLILAVVILPLSVVAAGKTNLDIKGTRDGSTYILPSKTLAITFDDPKTVETLKENISVEEGERLSFKDKDGNDFDIVVVPTGRPLATDFVDGVIKRARAEGKEATKGETPEGDPCLLQRELLRINGEDKGYGRINIVFGRNGTIFDVVMVTLGYSTTSEASAAMEKGFMSFWERVEFRGEFIEYPLLKEPIDPLVAQALNVANRVAMEKGLEFKVTASKKEVAHLIVPGSHDIEIMLGLVRFGPKVAFTQAFTSRGDEISLAEATKKQVVRLFKKRLGQENIPYIEDSSPDIEIMPSINGDRFVKPK